MSAISRVCPVLFLSLLFLLPATLRAELRINEFVADNDGSLLDADGEDSDWIELSNSGPDPVSLGGLYLTDRITEPTRWPLPDLTLPGGAYLVIFASGKDRRDPAQELHTNFALSADGEYLGLIDRDGFTPLSEFGPAFPRQFHGTAYGRGTNANTEPATFIPWPAAATWTVASSGVGADWRELSFDDSAWNSAQTGIGFGYFFPDFIGSGGDTRAAMFGSAPGAYIRIPFQIEDPAEVVALNLDLFYEDGFAAYLNGERVASANLPDPLDFQSTATASREIREDNEMDRFELDFPGKLQAGDNLLAFHLLNNDANSSDVLLIPELSGETRDLSGGLLSGYLLEPTPGAPNSGIEFTGMVADTSFDIDRGFFESPFEVTITSATPGATITFTTDGSTPTLTNGTVVPARDGETPPEASVEITTSSVLRAAAFKEGLRPTNVDTQTYLFLDDVLDQPAQPFGYPLPWRGRSGNVPGDFEMDPQVVGNIYPREELKEALRDLPTISVVTDIPNLFDPQTGIQVNPRDAGPASERPVSVEMIDFEDGRPMQLNAGMRMNGNASRSPNRSKHNFRLAFRNEYGPGRLRFPLFGADAPTETFNQIILRGGNGNSWVHPSSSVRQHAMYIRDQWFRDANTAMGYPEALQREVHVYLNGLYFGVHHLFERIEEEWTAERFGGEEDEWEGFRIVGGNNIEVIQGTPDEERNRMLESWRTLLDAARNRDFATVEQYLDLDRFIDYILLNYHAGNTDWDQNNVRAMRRLNPPGKFMFFCHDAERSGLNGLTTGNLNINSITHPRSGTEHRPTSIDRWLRTNPEYRLRFADRVYKHLFNDGALTPENGRAQWEARAAGIRTALKAESARWGDQHDSRPRTLVDFQRGLDREYEVWFPRRTPITISQLRAFNLYPELEPPLFNHPAGQVPGDFALLMTNEGGDIYYTTDGSDPRVTGGAINPSAIRIDGAVREETPIRAGADGWKYLDTGSEPDAEWKNPGFDETGWGTGRAPLGFGRINDHPLGGPWINPGRHLTVYFRKEVKITGAAQITEATARVMSDGGAIVYLNGIEIARDNMPDGPVDSQTPALSDSNESEGHIDIFDFPPSAFREGTNVFALSLHNGNASSSDMGMDLQIDLTALNTPADAITVDETITVKARSFDGSEWSALAEATFTTAAPASADNLVISEIFYHPAGALEKSEYLELLNIGDVQVSLAGVTFTDGIGFTFPDDATLAPGARILLVADRESFEAAFGTGLPVAGVFSGRLANDGERLRLVAADGSPLADFQYQDRAPWPGSADGSGFSLTLIAPGTNPGYAEAVNWRASLQPGGSPASSDALPFTGSTSNDLLNYALADPSRPLAASRQPLAIDGTVSDYFVASIVVNPGADEARPVIEFSPNLIDWSQDSAIYLGSSREANGTFVRRWRSAEPVSAGSFRFARLILENRS